MVRCPKHHLRAALSLLLPCLKALRACSLELPAAERLRVVCACPPRIGAAHLAHSAQCMCAPVVQSCARALRSSGAPLPIHSKSELSPGACGTCAMPRHAGPSECRRHAALAPCPARRLRTRTPLALPCTAPPCCAPVLPSMLPVCLRPSHAQEAELKQKQKEGQAALDRQPAQDKQDAGIEDGKGGGDDGNDIALEVRCGVHKRPGLCRQARCTQDAGCGCLLLGLRQAGGGGGIAEGGVCAC